MMHWWWRMTSSKLSYQWVTCLSMWLCVYSSWLIGKKTELKRQQHNSSPLRLNQIHQTWRTRTGSCSDCVVSNCQPVSTYLCVLRLSEPPEPGSGRTRWLQWWSFSSTHCPQLQKQKKKICQWIYKSDKLVGKSVNYRLNGCLSVCEWLSMGISWGALD